MTKRKCVITGAQGYLGSKLREYMAQQDWEVIEWVRNPSARDGRFVLGDAVDPETLRGVSCIIHCAWDLGVKTWEAAYRINVEGTQKLFDSASQAGVSRKIFISSLAAFPGARSIYGKSKLEAERRVQRTGAITFRPGLIYGEPLNGLFGVLNRLVQRSPLVPVVAAQNIQFLCEDNYICRIIERACSLDDAAYSVLVGAPINLAHPRPWAFGELLRKLASDAKRKVIFIPIPKALVMGSLWAIESLGIRIKFRRDGLMGLIYQNESPDFSTANNLGPPPPMWGNHTQG